MHRVIASIAFLCALASISGCAPSHRRLLAGRHYPEALVGVRRGALDGAVVLAAIARDLEVGAHLQAVPADMLRARLPGGPAGFDDLALVRVIHDSHTVPLPELAVSFGLLQGGEQVPPVDTSIEALARRSREALPEPEVIEHAGTTDYKLVVKTRRPGLEFFARVLFNVATVGLLHGVVPIVRDEGRRAYSEVRPPSRDDYARVSPAAEALMRWIAPSGCEGLGERCEQYVLWSRKHPGPLELLIVVRLGSYRAPALLYRVSLPPGPLDAGLRAIFGDRVRRLDALTRKSGHLPQVSYYLRHPEFSPDDTLTPASRRDLCRKVQGTRRRPGLRSRADLRFTLELGQHAVAGERRALQLREVLLACGLAAAQIELVELDSYYVELRVRHAIDP